MAAKQPPKAPVPMMVEATIGAGGTMDAEVPVTPAVGSIDDVVAAFSDALRSASQPVVRTAVDDVVAFVQAGDVLATASKQQLQGLLRVVLSTVYGPSKTFHWSLKVIAVLGPPFSQHFHGCCLVWPADLGSSSKINPRC